MAEHSFITVAEPFAASRVAAVESKLDDMSNPASQPVRDGLGGKGVHFISITVVPPDPGEPAHLVIEASTDGTPDTGIRAIAEGLAAPLRDILTAAGIEGWSDHLEGFLTSRAIKTGSGLLDVPGLNFAGTPGMTVGRISLESRLARKLRDGFGERTYAGSPLAVLTRVRAEVEAMEEFRPLLRPEPTGRLLGPAAGGLGPLAILGLAAGAIRTFLWPYLLLAICLIGLATYAASRAGATAAVLTLTLTAFVALLGLLGIVAGLYLLLRRLEASDQPDNTMPESNRLAEVTRRESRRNGVQNHLAGVSVMKPGWFRRLTLRFAFWTIGELAARSFRPGYLGDIGTIHFARWVLIPKTDKLLFFSNYGGSWESYLEDFITKAHAGLTGAWSNTEGFPRTRTLFFDGATDGDRFKRWARRQQWPTRFWYGAYPHLTTDRIRLNAAIRQGLATARTEDEAAAWLSCFGSRTRPAGSIETTEVQTLLFGGLKHHPHAACLLLRLPDEPASARAWLADTEPLVTFGDQPPTDRVTVLALTASALPKLALPNATAGQFAWAFRTGMADPVRSTVLADTSEDQPATWLWGNARNPVDVALLLYAADADGLAAATRDATARIEASGGSVAHQVTLRAPLAGTPQGARPVEPFGFVDGVSQPIIRGTRRWMREADKIHVVDPGEFILGYPDNRGTVPDSPTLAAAEDPDAMLPVAGPAHSGGAFPSFDAGSAGAPRDFGRNGSYLVIRQLEQDVEAFNAFVDHAATQHAGHPGIPQETTAPDRRAQWIAAKMVGRWKDGTSLVRYPHRPGTGWDGEHRAEPDNSFLPGAEDPLGERCPYGAHILRSNPRDSLAPGSAEQLAITNRHRILRAGRIFDAAGSGDAEATKPGLLFMCMNADIERQFEFIQQTWNMSGQFMRQDNEVDSIIGRGQRMGRLTIPTPAGPIFVQGVKDFVRVRGGGYFFMPGRKSLRYLAQPRSRAALV